MKQILLILMCVFAVNASAITVQPVNDTVAIGDTASFTLTATGATSYQWYINSSPVGTNSNTLKFVADSTMDSASIYCTVSNGESVNSNTVNLIVYWFYRDSITTLLNAKGIETMSYFAPSHRPSDPKQCAFIKANYDWVTTGFNFNNICKGRRTYSFAALDSIINYEYGIGKKIEYNALFWGYPNTIPTWLRSAGYNSDTLKQVCFEYIDTMFNRYRGKIQSWQLFNEILGANVTKMFYGNYLDSNITNFYKVVTDYANSKKGSMLIGYNDYMMYNLPYNGNRIYLRVLDSLHRAGLSFDYLGWQCHMYVDSTTQYRYNFLTDIYNRTKSYFNVPIDVTEFDIRIPDAAADTAANFIKQSQVAKSFVYQFVKQLGVRRFGFWGWDDGNSWVPTSFPGYGYATPRSSWDNVSRDYPTKPLYSAIVNALKSTNESIVNQNNNEIMIRVNYTAIPKDLTNQTMMFDLHSITSTQFWSTVKTGGTSIGLFDSSGNTLIATQLTDFNSTTKRGWLMWTDSVDCDKFKYYKIKLMGGTYEKTGSAISKIDMLPDFSDNITDKTLTEKTGNVIFDSVVNSGTFTQDTCKYGYYLKSNGSNLISSKTASATLRNDTGSYTIIFRYDTTSVSSQSILTFTDKVANKINSWVSSVFGSTSKGKSKIQLAPSLVDSTWHIVTFTWERTRARMLIDGRKLEDTTNAYVATFSGNVTPSLFAHYNSTESYNGAISKVIVYDTVQSLAKQSFMHAQLSDNQGVFEFNEPSGHNSKSGAFRKAYKDVYRNAWK